MRSKNLKLMSLHVSANHGHPQENYFTVFYIPCKMLVLSQ